MLIVFWGATPHQRMIPHLADVRGLLAWCGLPVCQLTILVAGVACLTTVFGACFFPPENGFFFDDHFLGHIFSKRGEAQLSGFTPFGNKW